MKTKNLLKRAGLFGAVVLAIFAAMTVAGLILNGIGFAGVMMAAFAVIAAAFIFANYPKVKVAIDHHASPTDVGRVFAKTRPRLAMLTHLALLPPDPLPMDDLLAELAVEYDGIVLIAEDLMTIRIGANISIEPYRHPAR